MRSFKTENPSIICKQLKHDYNTTVRTIKICSWKRLNPEKYEVAGEEEIRLQKCDTQPKNHTDTVIHAKSKRTKSHGTGYKRMYGRSEL